MNGSRPEPTALAVLRYATILGMAVLVWIGLVALTSGCTCVYVTTEKWTLVGASCFQDVDLSKLYYTQNGTNVAVGLDQMKREINEKAVGAVVEGAVKGIGEVVKGTP